MVILKNLYISFVLCIFCLAGWSENFCEINKTEYVFPLYFPDFDYYSNQSYFYHASGYNNRIIKSIIHLRDNNLCAETPVILGDSKLYINISEPDSINLWVENIKIVQWLIEKQGSIGTAIVRPDTGNSVCLIYYPSAENFSSDTIVVKAMGENGESNIKTLYAQLYNNSYQYYGEKLLDRIRKDFYNGIAGLFAESIDADGDFIAGVSYIWPASHLLRAFKNGYRINPDKYRTVLRFYTYALDKYKSTAGGKVGYAAFPGEPQRFYDDNGLLIIQFAEIYPLLEQEGILDRAGLAYDYNNNDRDQFWGLPQHESELGQGMFYSMAVNQTGLGAALLYNLTHESKYLDEAISYYEQLNNPEILLKDPSYLLFHQYTFYQNASWSYSGIINGQPRNGAGFRAYQTTHVIQLAIELYKITGDAKYRSDGLGMMDKAITYWYKQGKGLYENSFWGGDDMIDALIDMYYLTGEGKYLDISKDIIDYLVFYGKDKLGYYPGDYDDNYGRWNLDRREIIPASILMMGQAAAASAILRVAYAVEHSPVINGSRQDNKFPEEEIKVFPTSFSTYDKICIYISGLAGSVTKAELLSIEGKMIQQGYFHTEYGMDYIEFPGRNVSPGIYIINISTNRGIIPKKLFVK